MPAHKKVDRTEFARLHAQGLTQAQLAAHFGIARSNVIAINTELGLRRRKPKRIVSPRVDRAVVERMHNDGLTLAQIANELGCAEYTVWRIRKELGLAPMRYMTPERRARIQEMLNDGWSWKEIERTEGANWDTMRRHFPGTQWTHQHVGHMVAATRNVRPRLGPKKAA